MSNGEASIRVGLIGAGANTTYRHIPGFQALPGVQITCVANRSRESSQRVADEFGIPEIKDSWQQVIESDEVDAVSIGTWPYLHCEATCAALEKGKHVLCEARMARDLQEARTMLETSRKFPHLTAQIVPSPFGFSVDRTVRELIDSGWLGQVLAVNLRETSGDFADFEAPLHWRHRRDLSGLNCMAMGIWYETSMRWLGHVRSVSAQGKISVTERTHPETGEKAAIEIPDHLTILAEYPGGVAATLQFSVVTGLNQESAAWIFGTEGTLKYDGVADQLWGAQKGATELQKISIDPDKALDWRVEEEFINAIRGREKVRLTDFETGVRYMEFTEAVYRSRTQGVKVDLPL